MVTSAELLRISSGVNSSAPVRWLEMCIAGGPAGSRPDVPRNSQTTICATTAGGDIVGRCLVVVRSGDVRLPRLNTPILGLLGERPPQAPLGSARRRHLLPVVGRNPYLQTADAWHSPPVPGRLRSEVERPIGPLRGMHPLQGGVTAERPMVTGGCAPEGVPGNPEG